MTQKQIPSEVLLDLRKRLDLLSPRSHERRLMIQETSTLYGISQATLYRFLSEISIPKSLRRSDCGKPRVLPRKEMEFFCELIAAIKIRTSNNKGRNLSTGEALRLLEAHGISVDGNLVKVPEGLLKKTTVNRYLKKWGYDCNTLRRQPPAVRFQASHSNECWHFDLSVSDLKSVEEPLWLKEGEEKPLLMLYSIVDDRSGTSYQEYHCVYGEDVGAALRFLFNAMSPKNIEGFPLQGIPEMIYTDNGPIARSKIFCQVMKYLGVEIKTHIPGGKDGTRVTARSKGKVERPFRTVKEMHETLYHFHKPRNEAEANAWLLKFLIRYNDMQHRSESHSRIEDWQENLPPQGIRQMCSWDRFCTFAREPERRKVGIDCRVSVDGISYEVDPNLSGETVILWWGIFDNELYVEHEDTRYGPYSAVSGAIPLHKYRKFKKTDNEKRAERIESMAAGLSLPASALPMVPHLTFQIVEQTQEENSLAVEAFVDPDPFHELYFSNRHQARLAISDFLSMPLGRLEKDQLEKIESILDESLKKPEVIEKVKFCFLSSTKEQEDVK